MQYKYTDYLPDETGKLIRRPMIEITIFGPKSTHKELALLDSGADRTLLSMEVANFLGIDLSNARISSTRGIIGSGIETKTVILEIQAEYLNKIKVPVGFIETKNFNALIGQDGFFDLHKIKFERDHKVFEITPVKK